MNYNGKCRQLHGHNAKVVITVASPDLDDLGMVTDFSAMRRHIGDWIERTLDHRMILHKDDPYVPILRGQGDPVVTLESHPSTENLAKFIFDFVESEGYPVVEVTLWETPTSYATYSLAGVVAHIGEE
jgi:6-pyruvoyltetrahydropterin/6-carboxytetrahydropterin synthase